LRKTELVVDNEQPVEESLQFEVQGRVDAVGGRLQRQMSRLEHPAEHVERGMAV